MSKLEYDNLYKFLVSLGIVLIVLPVAFLVFIFNSELVLISQVDYDALSAFSQQMVQQHEQLASCFAVIFPWYAVASFIIGLFLLIFGICKWVDVQKNIDKKLDAETTIQSLTVLQMTPKEVEKKIETEIKEDTLPSDFTDVENVPVNSQLNHIEKYIEIENKCFNYFTRIYGKRYSFTRNIRIGAEKYDFIGVSQRNNIDLIFEIKYLRNVADAKNLLKRSLNRFYDAGVKYEAIAHRNFKCIVVLVTTKDQVSRLHAKIEEYRYEQRENVSQIEIKCFAEEEL